MHQGLVTTGHLYRVKYAYPNARGTGRRFLDQVFRGVRIYLVAGSCAVYEAALPNGEVIRDNSLQYVMDCIFEATFKKKGQCCTH